jgi:hypothetical protein
MSYQPHQSEDPTLKPVAGAALEKPDSEVATEPKAWMHEDDPSRVISAAQKQQALRDGGASATSVRPYSIALGSPAPAGQTLTDEQVSDLVADASIDANLSPKFCLDYAVSLNALVRAVLQRRGN